MEVVFNIIDNLPSDSIIILTILFTEQYNISIGKDDNSIRIYLFDSEERSIQRFYATSKSYKYKKIKNYIINLIDNIPINRISGISNSSNKEFLKNYFLVSNNDSSDSIINIDKYFY